MRPGDKEIVMAIGKLHSVIGITGLESNVAGVTVLRDAVYRGVLPERFTRDDIRRVQEDVRVLGEIASDRQEELMRLLDAVAEHKIGEAIAIARKIGLTEERFRERDGGMLGIIILAIVILVALEGSAG
jgi:hypothetical protein